MEHPLSSFWFAVGRAGGQCGNQGALGQHLDRLGEFLEEGHHLVGKVPGLDRIDGDFIHQEQGRLLPQHLVKQVLPRCPALEVVLAKQLILAQLLGQFAPWGLATKGVSSSAHKGRHPCLGHRTHPGLCEYGRDRLQTRQSIAVSQQVVKRNQAVGLAPAEGRLNLNDRLAPPLARKARQNSRQQVDQAPRGIGLGEKGLGVPVLQGTPVGDHIGQVCRKHRLIEPAHPRLRAGHNHFTPRFHGAPPFATPSSKLACRGTGAPY